MATETALRNLERHTDRRGDGCWEWQGTCYPGGYGKCYIGGAGRGRGAHRMAYEAFVGEIPEGLVINHLCENKRCVRPDHLEAVSIRENILYSDTAARRNVAKTHCPQGHPYSGANLYVGPKGYRFCRLCAKDKQRRYRERKREVRE